MPRHDSDQEDKPCRACSDFKTWAKGQSKAKITPTGKKTTKRPKDCPLDKDEIGRATWSFLHSMASYYPEQPTTAERDHMKKFFLAFSHFYPCEPCALDFQEDIEKHPPKTGSRNDLAKWLCDRHNTVNKKLNKPLFDCSKVHERWKDGWADGSCD